jgi:hypothetical protein
MTILGNNNLAIYFRGFQRGVSCITRIDYTNLDSPSTVAPAAFSDEILATVVPLWLDVMALDYVLSEFEVFVYGPAPDISILTPVNANGLVVSDALPPFVSQRIFKLPNNTALEGGGGEPFKKGRISLPGVPESAQHNGILTSAHQAKLQDLADALASVVPAAPFDDQYVPWMYRPLPEGAVPVLTMASSNQLGTQNSRKR